MSLFQTLLFAPANHHRKVEKALNLSIDAVIIDLEDACALNEKVEARNDVSRFLKLPRKPKAYVRVNAITTPFFFEDVTTVVCKELDGIVLPMTQSRDDIIIAAWILSSLEEKYGLPQMSIDLLPLIETAKGISNIKSILTASNRVKRVAFGAGDYTYDTGMDWGKSGEELLYARTRIVNESRAANVEAPIDTVYIDLKDNETLIKETHLAKSLGFQGKLLIHPQQIEIVKTVFRPSAEAVKNAEEIINAFKEAEKNGSSSIRVGDQFVDYPVVYKAQKIIELAQKLE